MLLFDNPQATALTIRILGIGIFIFKVFPRVYQEMLVTDGIRRLRVLIALGIGLFFLGGLLLAHMNFCNIHNCDPLFPRDINVLMQSSLFTLVSIILYMIYHEKYHDEEVSS